MSEHHGGFLILSHQRSTHVYGMFPTIWYPKKLFLCVFLMHFAALWFLITPAVWGSGTLGCCLAEVLLLHLYSHHCLELFFFAHLDLCLLGESGEGCVGDSFLYCGTPHSPLHTWFQGESEQVAVAWASFPCCLMETNYSIFSCLFFFRHGANQIQILNF